MLLKYNNHRVILLGPMICIAVVQVVVATQYKSIVVLIIKIIFGSTGWKVHHWIRHVKQQGGSKSPMYAVMANKLTVKRLHHWLLFQSKFPFKRNLKNIFIKGTCKMRNEIETKRNKSKQNWPKRNETKRNNSKWN